MSARARAGEVLAAFARLGCTSFGGPVAHLGYFRAEFVARRGWLSETAYADIVALCQFLPGPASSQVAVSLGLLRAGLPGGFAAWLGFTAPSALALILFAYGISRVGALAQAVWGMARNLCPDRERASLAVGAAVLALAVPSAAGQLGAIAIGGLIGWRVLPAPAVTPPAGRIGFALPRLVGPVALALFFALLAVLPVAAAASGWHGVALVDRFYRAGALVFGGGHVVLPLLQRAVVPPGWISPTGFLAGYGAAQAVPGPLFTFAAYLGASMRPGPSGWLGGVLCLGAIYLPSFLLLLGVLPYWDRLRSVAPVQAALRGVNAAVVGLLLAALYTPVWTSAITGPAAFAITLAAFLLLVAWRVPPWLVVGLGAVAGAALLG